MSGTVDEDFVLCMTTKPTTLVLDTDLLHRIQSGLGFLSWVWILLSDWDLRASSLRGITILGVLRVRWIPSLARHGVTGCCEEFLVSTGSEEMK